MSNPEITIDLHKNVVGDLPERLEAFAKTLASQPKSQEAVLACRDVIATWLKQETIRVSCTRSLASWEWLRDICCQMKAYTAATVIETKLGMWHRERSDAASAKALREEREAFVARGEDL